MQPLVYFYPDGHAEHRAPGHPERPERVEAIQSALQAAGWWQPYPHLTPSVLPAEVLHAVHSPAYLSALQLACRRGGFLDQDTYVTPASWLLAHRSAGGAAAVAQAVWRGQARRGFALCRPPGHHALRGQGMGFCLLNNIALAAQSLVLQHGVQRIAIVDLDLHHGNGTQDIFWQRGDVFFCSVHQAPLYPGTGKLWERGAGAGEGMTANFPLLPGSGDRAYLAFMDALILPLLARVAPQIVLVSYGFDAHWMDPLGNLALSAGAMGRLVQRLAAWADDHCEGKLAIVLEGGYDLDAAAACSQAVVAALLGTEWCDTLGEAPYPESASWQTRLQEARQLWALDR
ncbi:MAG: histone deacetylase family protein [Chloroflexota bacterium]